MTSTYTDGTRGGWSLPSTFGRGLTALVMVVILAIGGLASGLLYVQESAAADDAEADSVARIGESLAKTGDVLIAGVAGATALTGPDGAVERQAFETFAATAAGSTALTTLAYEPIVTSRGRAAFEAELGSPITERGPSGFQPAASRPTYLPVRWVHPVVGESGSLVGFDIASDPVRAAAAVAARDTGGVVFSQPVASQPSGAPGFFMIRALYRPDVPVETIDERRAAVVGYVSSAVSATVLMESIATQLPAGARLEITDGGEPLAATADAPERGHTAQAVRGGRVWTVRLDHRDADHRATYVMMLSTVGVALLAGGFLLRNRRQTHELRTSAEGVRLLGRLSEHLAVADSRDDVVRTIDEHAAPALAASCAVVAVPTADGRGLAMTQAPGSGRSPFPWTVDTDASSSIVAEAWRSGEAVRVRDLGELRQRFPSDAESFVAAGCQSAAVVPLRRPDGAVIGVLAAAWARKRALRPRVLSTLDATAEVCRQSLVRADVQEQRRLRAAALSILGQRLSAARTHDDVAREVVLLGPRASGADYVAIVFLSEAGNTMRLVRSLDGQRLEHFEDLPVDPGGPLLSMLRRGERVRLESRAEIEQFPALRRLVDPRVEQLVVNPLVDSVGRLRGAIGFVFAAGNDVRRQPDSARYVTIADLTAQTVERADLYQQQHELVVRLQQRTLPDLPQMDGLRVAARYLPSSSALGMGGDWYDVQALGDGRYGVVVGDVVGHGIDAIADMTEIRTTVSTLLRSEVELGEVAGHATALLAAGAREDEVVFATAVLMVIDTRTKQLAYARAGHPPPMLRRPGMPVAILEGAGSTPIGVPGPSASVHRMAFTRGSVVVAYTDGLVERRGEHLDVGLARLTGALAEGADHEGIVVDDPDEVADRIVAACLEGRETEDDAAVVVLVVT